jgi:uncharacterized protein with GYD domain
MPKYLFHGNFTAQAVKGVVQEGGTGRVKAVEKLAQSVGGKLESYYFAFGDTDYYIVLDLPDNNAAAAISLTVGGSGSVANKTTVLMTPAEVDEAVKKHPSYRPPGA